MVLGEYGSHGKGVSTFQIICKIINEFFGSRGIALLCLREAVNEEDRGWGTWRPPPKIATPGKMASFG